MERSQVIKTWKLPCHIFVSGFVFVWLEDNLAPASIWHRSQFGTGVNLAPDRFGTKSLKESIWHRSFCLHTNNLQCQSLHIMIIQHSLIAGVYHMAQEYHQVDCATEISAKCQIFAFFLQRLFVISLIRVASWKVNLWIHSPLPRLQTILIIFEPASFGYKFYAFWKWGVIVLMRMPCLQDPTELGTYVSGVNCEKCKYISRSSQFL